jgi:hypothetical protein
MMLSVFSPVNRNLQPHALKVTMTSQEWCGQTFAQINRKGKKYTYTGHSYFEKEGDEELTLKITWLEDELWNLIRLDPEQLPTGETQLIPGFFFSRLQHKRIEALAASITKKPVNETVHYRIELPDQHRSLEIIYAKKFPHQILGWEESVTDHNKTFLTTATLDKTLLNDYWTKNKNEFRFLRDSLGLSPNNF